MKVVSKERPFGTTLIGLFNVIGGSFGFFSTLFVLFGSLDRNISKAPSLLSTSIGPYWLILTSIPFFFSGIGLWRGKRWGWWLASFFETSALVTGLCNLALFPPSLQKQEAAGALSHSFSYYYLKELAGLSFSILVLYYLFRPKVRGFCELLALNLRKAILILLILAVGYACVARLVTSSY